MKILLATAHPHLPQITGGAQSSIDALALALNARGHQAVVLAGLTKEGMIGLRSRLQVKLLKRGYAVDHSLGYPTARTWFPWTVATAVNDQFRPDIVVVQSGLPAKIAVAFRDLDVATSIFFHNVEFDDLEGMGRIADHHFANSRFTAEEIARRYGLHCDIIPPFLDGEPYRVPRRGQHITFINPNRKKGLDLALGLVEAMPDLPFLFVKAQSLAKDEIEDLEAARARFPNLQIRDSIRDMTTVYGDTRLLIMPSVWEEAWGRVASEAHYSGIPVVGSARGGIPESVGPGGTIMAPGATVADWASTIRAIVSDEALYDRLSAAALAFSKRDELRFDSQVDRFVALCENVVATRTK